MSLPKMIRSRANSEATTFNNQPKLINEKYQLIRPAQDTLADGTYKATIKKAYIASINGKLMLKLEVNVIDDGNGQDESFILNPSFRNPSSAFYKLLEVTDCMPGRGEALNTEALEGYEVMLSLCNVNKNGNVYVNIVDVEALPDEEGDNVIYRAVEDDSEE